jgi:predicted MFS family arabinose efflux permease
LAAEAREGAPARLFTPPFVRLLAMQAAYGFSFSMFFLLPKYLASVGEPPARIGFVMAGFGVACILTIPFLRAIGQTLGRRGTLIAANLLLATAAALFGLADRPGLLAVPLRASEGVTWTLMFSTAIALTAELAPPDRLAQAIGLAGGASLIMNALAPAVGEPLADHYGYRSVFFVAALAAVGAAVLARRLPLTRTSQSSPVVDPKQGAHVSVAESEHPASRSAPVAIYLVFGAAGLAFSSLFAFLAPFALGHGVHAVRAFFVGYTSAAITVRVFGGRLSDRLGHRAVATSSLLLYGGAVASAGILAPYHLGLLGLAFGTAHGAAYPALMALLVQGTPPSRRPRVLGVANGAMSLGISAVAPAGVLAARLGYPALFALVGGLTSLAALLLIPRECLAPAAMRGFRSLFDGPAR